jgi:polyisoprenoid-binding protein YceI
MENVVNTGVANDTTEKVEWSLDMIHSKIGFSVRHLVVSQAHGHFNEFKVNATSLKRGFAGGEVEVRIPVKSIETEMPDRNKHLLSDDFFNAEKFPEIVFKSKSIEKIDDENYKVTGDLMIRDITKEVTFDVTYGGEILDGWGFIRVGFNVTGVINREEFGVKFNTILESGAVALAKNVKVNCDFELTRKA